MPFGNSGTLSRRDFVKIAQRFNAGSDDQFFPQVPEGRLKSESETQPSAVPPGLASLLTVTQR